MCIDELCKDYSFDSYIITGIERHATGYHGHVCEA